MAKKTLNTQPVVFEWNEYGRAVLQGLEMLQDEVERMRGQIEEIQKMTATVQTLVSELSQLKSALESYNKSLSDLKKEFGNCQLSSVKHGGENSTALATLEEKLKNAMSNRALFYSIAAGVVAILVSVLVKIIFKF